MGGDKSLPLHIKSEGGRRNVAERPRTQMSSIKDIDMQQQLPAGHALQGGKYKILKTIGQGGFGITYRAEMVTEVTGALGGAKVRVPVAVKEFFFADHCRRDAQSQAVVTDSAIAGAQMFERFKVKLIKEATILSRLRHDNIVSVIDIFEENGTAYMVMDFVEGRSLEQVVRDAGGMLTPAQAIHYASQLCYAVDAIHRAHVLHLDIKPGNVLVDNNDNVRVIDFGISKQYDNGHQETSTTPVGISKGYAPVEQYSDMSRFTPQTDIYAIGATLYYMLTGTTPVESITRVASDQLTPVQAVNASVSDHLAMALARAMSLRPDDRHASAAELSADLNATSPSRPVTQPTQPQPDTDTAPTMHYPTPSEPPVVPPASRPVSIPVSQPLSGLVPETPSRPGGLRITMLCLGLTFGLIGLLMGLVGYNSYSYDAIAVALSSMIIANVANAWTSMIICPGFKGAARMIPCLVALLASALFLFRYIDGLNYDYPGYIGQMIVSALSSTAATIFSFGGYKNPGLMRWLSLGAVALSALLWCTASL